MILWRLQDPRNQMFAEAGWRGAWSEGEYCPECTGSTEERIQPLIMEWEAGSDVIGDFTCTGVCSGFAITEQVANELQQSFKGFELGLVKMIEPPRLKRPKRVTKQTKPRIWLPYTGPTLYELWRTTWVHMDPTRTTATLVRRCSRCKNERYELTGMQHMEWEWDIELGKMHNTNIPRALGQGLFVRASDLEGADIFGVLEFSGWVFCTDRVRQFIEEHEFTNITFEEMGEVIQE